MKSFVISLKTLVDQQTEDGHDTSFFTELDSNGTGCSSQ